jgi:hypothetical protein
LHRAGRAADFNGECHLVVGLRGGDAHLPAAESVAPPAGCTSRRLYCVLRSQSARPTSERPVFAGPLPVPEGHSLRSG